jgi:hypothetical protein
MGDIPRSLKYWGEQRVCSVANLTRRDGGEFIALMKHSAKDPRRHVSSRRWKPGAGGIARRKAATAVLMVTAYAYRLRNDGTIHAR